MTTAIGADSFLRKSSADATITIPICYGTPTVYSGVCAVDDNNIRNQLVNRKPYYTVRRPLQNPYTKSFEKYVRLRHFYQIPF